MKKFFLLSFLLPVIGLAQQVGFITYKPPFVPEPPAPCFRTIVSDYFGGSSLSGNWTVRHPEAQTISVSGGELHLAGSGSNKDFSKRIMNTGYGLSTIRNYITTLEFQINAINSNCKGVYVGVHSEANNPSYRFSSYSVIAFDGLVDTLSFSNSDDSIFFGNVAARTTAGIPDINTSDTYKLILEVDEDSSRTTFINVTAQDTARVNARYNFTVSGVWPLRPSLFYYGFGIMGSTDIDVLSFTATTTECPFPDILFVGNSIPTGYTAESCENSFAYKLRANTSDTIQIMAGGGMTILNTIQNASEIIAHDPEYVFLEIGTNAPAVFADYQTLVTTLEAAGIDVIPMMIVNGGDPATGGTFNNSIAVTYSDEIDLWTTGWNTMSIANGEMESTVHPSNSGMTKLAAIIKAAKPTIFPL